MKKLFSISLFLIIPLISLAQFNVGLKAGAGFTTSLFIQGNQTVELESINGRSFGVIMQYLAVRNAGVQVEVLRQTKGWQQLIPGVDGYFIFTIVPHHSFTNSSDFETTFEEDVLFSRVFLYNDRIDNRFTYGLSAGMGLKYVKNKNVVQLEARFSNDFQNNVTDERLTYAQHQVFSVTLSYLYQIIK